MRRGMVGLAALGAVLLALVLLLPAAPVATSSRAAQDGTAEATATRAAEEAELADLRTRVAVLSTEVALLGGADAETLAGRLGGSRAGFDAAFGPPVAFIGASDVSYDVPEVGRLTATFADDRARRLVVSAPRPAATPITEPDPADWTLDQAREIAQRFAPADASLADEPAEPDNVELTVDGTSQALGSVLSPVDEAGCPPADGGGTFTVVYTTPTPETVSTITLELAESTAALPPVTPTAAEEGRASRGGSAVANSSLGGTVTVNGIRVQAHRVRTDAEAATTAAPDHSFVAVELTIENMTDRALVYALPDFVLVDAAGGELTAVCGGADPAITRGELAPGEAVEGWVSFQVPPDFAAERLVFLVDNARVGFGLD